MNEKMNMMTTVAIRPWREPEILDDLVAMCKASGTTDVAVMYMCHPEGLPLLAKFADYAAQFTRIKARLSAIGVRSGVLLQTILDHAERFQPLSPAPFQRITGFDGTVCHACFCPLDRDFLQFVRDMTLVLAKTRPDFFLVDDDVRLDNHSPARWACACPLHVDLFNQRAGLSYSRDDLFAAMKRADETGLAARTAWQEAGDESLLVLLQTIRSAIDAVDPAIRCGKCISGGKHLLRSGPLVRALAGATKPFARFGGAYYLASGYAGFPHTIARNALQRTLIGDGIELMCEADTYPHARYNTPVKHARGYVSAMLLAAEIDIPYSWIPGTMEWIPNDVKAYSRMFAENIPFFTALKEVRRTVTWSGPTVINNGLSRMKKPWDENDHEYNIADLWGGTICGHLGIPFTCNDAAAAVAMLDGDAVHGLSRAELEKVFSGGVLLDGSAAAHLSLLGHDDLMGVHAVDGDNDLRFDFEHFGPDAEIHGTSVNRYEYATRSLARQMKRLAPINDRTRIASRFVAASWYNAADQREVSPALTVFENHLGGRVAVYAHVLDTFTIHAGFMNDIRKEQLIRLFAWLGKIELPAVAHTGVDTYLLYGDDKDAHEHVAAVFNCSQDEIEPLVMRFDFGSPRSLDRLMDDGRWKPLAFSCVNGMTTIDVRIETMKPLILRLR